MKLKLVRKHYSKDTTIGELFIDGEFFCFTLEDTVRAWGIKVEGHTGIPAAANVYKVKLTHSQKFGRELPIIYTEDNGYELKHAGVSFKGVRFHRGNDQTDTWGCPLVGFNVDLDQFKISNSTQAETELIEKLRPATEISLTVINQKNG